MRNEERIAGKIKKERRNTVAIGRTPNNFYFWKKVDGVKK